MTRADARGLAWTVAAMVAWLWTWGHLRRDWEFNPQYQFGWLVPFLAAASAWHRLRAWSGRCLSPAFRAQMVARAAAWAGGLLFLLGEAFRQADPNWRAVGYLLAAGASVVSAGGCLDLGGRPLLRAMLFPIALAWLGSPWPGPVEVAVTQGLMHLVAGLATDLLNAFGVPALCRGNVIELVNGTVGVSEACSGVQSLQSSLAFALFFGELARFRTRERGALVIAAAAMAFLGNLGRTLALAALANTGGSALTTRWHDVTGYAASGTIFLGVLALALFLAQKRARSWPAPAEPPLRWMASAPAGNGLRALVLVMLAPALAWIWFTARGSAMRIQDFPLWSIRVGALPEGWQARRVEIPEASLRVLGCSEAAAWCVITPQRREVQVYHFFWRPDRDAPSLAAGHTPDTCLPLTGWSSARQEFAAFSAKGAEIPGTLFLFRRDHLQLAVFHAVWHGGEARRTEDYARPPFYRWDRLAVLWQKDRGRGREVLSVATYTAGTASDMREPIAKAVRALVRPSGGGH